ncbi:Citrinin biosynthesis cluster MFS transporter mrr1, partial [Hyphodiscus hymeniophilus]
NMASISDEEKGAVPSPTLEESLAEQSGESNLVAWTLPYDAENPLQWSYRKRWAITGAMGGMTVVVSFASSVFSSATVATAEEFHVSTEVTTLGTSLYILVRLQGNHCGTRLTFEGLWLRTSALGTCVRISWTMDALLWCIYRVLYFSSPSGRCAKPGDNHALPILGGIFGAGPLAVTAGVLSDMWGPIDRGAGIALFGLATFMGPGLGPVIGGFVTQTSLGWRWTAWITLIWGASFALIGLLIIPETYAPVILSKRASKLRHETKNWAIHAPFDEKELHFKAILNTYLLLPLTMLFQETILFLVSLYLSLVYCVLYLSLEAFPISFQEGRKWEQGIGSLPFLSLTIGFIIGGAIIVIQNYNGYAKIIQAQGQAPPEARLPPMMIGAVVFPIGLFWFGWTSYPSITWVPQVLSGVPIGIGCMLIFMQGLNYIVDAYRIRANSAVAASTFMRATMAAGFPMFAVPMFHKLTVQWAMSLLGFLAVALVPVPFAFYYYGKKIRRSSRYCAD